MNVVVVEGKLVHAPVLRTLASGVVLWSADLSVRDADVPAESVPLAWFDPPAKRPELEAGSSVLVVGRIRQRFFRSGATTQTRTELVVSEIVTARRKQRRSAVLTDIVEVLTGAPVH